MSEYGKRLLQGSTFIIASVFFVKIVGIFRSAIIARTLGPWDLGVLTIFTSITDIALQFAILSIPFALAKYVSEYQFKNREKASKIIYNSLWMMMILGFFLSVILFVSSGFISNFYQEPRLSFYLKLYAVFMLLPVFQHGLYSILQGFHKMKQISIYNMTTSIFGLVVIFILATKYGLLGVIISSLVIIVFIIILSLFGLRKVFVEENISIEHKFDMSIIKTLLIFSVPLFISAMIFRPANLFVNTIIFDSLGPDELGYYRIAFTIFMIMMMIPSSIQVPLLPLFSEANSRSKKDLKTFTTAVFKFNALIMLVISSMVILFSGPFVKIVYGQQYLQSINILAIFGCASFFNAMGTIFYTSIIGRGKTVLIAIMSALQALILVILSFLIIPKYGLIGASIIYIFTGIASLSIYLIYYSASKNISLTDVGVRGSLTSFIIIGLTIPIILVDFTYPFWMGALFALGIFAVIYFMLEKQEKTIINNMITGFMLLFK